MNVSLALAMLSAVAAALLIASVWAWGLAVVRLILSRNLLGPQFSTRLASILTALNIPPRLPLVLFSPRRPVPWALIDLLVLFGIYVLGSLVVSVILHELQSVAPGGDVNSSVLDDQISLVGANVLISLMIIVVGLPLVALRSKSTLRDFGWSRRKAWGDLKLGLIAFVMLTPPVYVLQGVLVNFWKPSVHPLMEMFKETPDVGLFGLLFVAAAVVAPLFEELIFRVMLQGFLEKAFSFRGEAHELFFGNLVRQVPVEPPVLSEVLPAAFVAASPDAAESLNPYAPPAVLTPGELASTRKSHADLQAELRGSSASLPILISSAIFALLHYSHGPDWIPLFLLATGLGYLYQRTHRLLPSLVVHFALNSLSMWGLWVQVQDGLAK